MTRPPLPELPELKRLQQSLLPAHGDSAGGRARHRAVPRPDLQATAWPPRSLTVLVGLLSHVRFKTVHVLFLTTRSFLKDEPLPFSRCGRPKLCLVAPGQFGCLDTAEGLRARTGPPWWVWVGVSTCFFPDAWGFEGVK